MTRPPFSLLINTAAHIVTIMPMIMASIPVKRKLGIRVIAGSPAVACMAGQASITIPFVATLP